MAKEQGAQQQQQQQKQRHKEKQPKESGCTDPDASKGDGAAIHELHKRVRNARKKLGRVDELHAARAAGAILSPEQVGHSGGEGWVENTL